MKFNQTKINVLGLLDRSEQGMTAEEVSTDLNKDAQQTSRLLGRYHRAGLLNRQRERGAGSKFCYRYFLSERGRQRLEYLTRPSESTARLFLPRLRRRRILNL